MDTANEQPKDMPEMQNGSQNEGPVELPKDTKIKFHETTIDAMVQHYLRGMRPADGEQIVGHHIYHDTASGRVMFKLFVREVQEAEKSNIIPARQ